jgi:hypothetical protein
LTLQLRWLCNRHPGRHITPVESRAMTVRLRALVLLLAICWQALSVLSPMAIDAKSLEYAHVAMHLEASDHHHHDDGSLHAEPLGNTLHHLHADGSFNATGLPPGAIGQAPPVRQAEPGAAPTVHKPSPYLEGPLRPPRSAV